MNYTHYSRIAAFENPYPHVPKAWVKHEGIQLPPDTLVSNQCCDCGFSWLDGPGVFASQDTCPGCGSLYWKAQHSNN